MIEPEDVMVPENSSIHNRLTINVPDALDPAKAETIAARWSQLESRPVLGAYDAVHLQQIHARLFEGVFSWAGKLRDPQSPALTSSLDLLFDRLARENRLKGLDGDAWSKRSTEYFIELTAIEPFTNGNELALLEFFRKLASENNMTLRRVNGLSEPSRDELQSELEQTLSNNLRRILMLAVDPYPAIQPRGISEARNVFELIAPA